MKEFMVECECHCGFLRFTKYDDDEEIVIEHYASSFYANQNSFSQTVWERIKMAWFMLTGKSYSLYDIVLNKEQTKEFETSMRVFLGIPFENKEDNND